MDCPTEIWTQIYVDIRDFTPCDHWVVPAYDGTCSVQNCYNWPKDGARRIISMMKTCKFLWDIGEPLLFRDVYNRRARHGQFVETIQKRPDVGKLVRTYEYASLAAIDGVPPIIHHLPNLKSLTLFHVTITKDIVDGLLAATQLEYLSISAMVRVPSPICQWSSAIPEDWSGGRFGQRLQTLRVRDFSANYGTKPGWLQLFSSNIKTLDLANLSETLEPIVTALRNGSVAFLNVTTLKIARSVFAPTDALKSASLVSEVISFCPELHNLWVESLNEVDCASVMPQLSYFGWLPLSSHNAVPSLRLAANLVSLQIGDTSVGYLSEIVMPNIKYLHAFSLRGAFIANLGLIAKCFPNVELLLLQGTQEPVRLTAVCLIHNSRLIIEIAAVNQEHIYPHRETPSAPTTLAPSASVYINVKTCRHRIPGFSGGRLIRERTAISRTGWRAARIGTSSPVLLLAVRACSCIARICLGV